MHNFKTLPYIQSSFHLLLPRRCYIKNKILWNILTADIKTPGHKGSKLAQEMAIFSPLISSPVQHNRPPHFIWPSPHPRPGLSPLLPSLFFWQPGAPRVSIWLLPRRENRSTGCLQFSAIHVRFFLVTANRFVGEVPADFLSTFICLLHGLTDFFSRCFCLLHDLAGCSERLLRIREAVFVCFSVTLGTPTPRSCCKYKAIAHRPANSLRSVRTANCSANIDAAHVRRARVGTKAIGRSAVIAVGKRCGLIISLIQKREGS